MGDVVSFPNPTRAATRVPSKQAAAAEILFFTGVRYQRMAEPAPTQTGGRPRTDGGVGAKRKRKRG